MGRYPSAYYRRRAARPQRGASAVEFALVAPLLFMLLFAIVEYATIFANAHALRTASSATARRAVVGDFGSDTSCGLVGAPTVTTETHQLVCLAKKNTDLEADAVRVKIAAPNSYSAGEPLVLCLEYPATSLTGFFDGFLDGRFVHTKAEYRIEVEHDQGLGQVAESPHVGSDWTWCT